MVFIPPYQSGSVSTQRMTSLETLLEKHLQGIIVDVWKIAEKFWADLQRSGQTLFLAYEQRHLIWREKALKFTESPDVPKCRAPLHQSYNGNIILWNEYGERKR